MSAVRCTAHGCGWTGRRKSAADLPIDATDTKPCPKCSGEVKVGGPAPTSIDTTPAGVRIAFWDEYNVESGLPQKRRYCVEIEGRWERLPSVTGVTAVLGPKDALAHWAWRIGRDGLDYREERDEAGRRGHAAHDLILRALLDEGASLAEMPDEFRGWGQAAYRWMRRRQPRVIAAEQMVASVAHGYAGRFDLLADKLAGLPPRLVVRVDFKTVTEWKYDKGKRRRPYPEHVLQLDAYEGAAVESGYPPANVGLVVRLGPDGTYDEHFFELDPDRFLRVYGAREAVGEANRALAKGIAELEPEQEAQAA